MTGNFDTHAVKHQEERTVPARWSINFISHNIRVVTSEQFHCYVNLAVASTLWTRNLA